MNKTIILMGLTFLSAFRSTNSIFRALIAGLVSGLVVYAFDLIWQSKQNLIFKILLLLCLFSGLGISFYILHKTIKLQSAKNLVQNNFSSEDLEKLKMNIN